MEHSFTILAICLIFGHLAEAWSWNEAEEYGMSHISAAKFTCENGRRLYREDWICDGVNDCWDGSDEDDCENVVKQCKVNQFRCSSGQCIFESHRCDTIPHCRDKSDEINCDCSKWFTNPFTCNNSNCIEDDRVCNGIDNCYDGSDENDCENRVCNDNQYRCSSGQCITGSGRCDQFDDCSDKSDEKYCNCSKIFNDPFTCKNGLCSRDNRVCDGRDDCMDGSDEADCENRVCKDNQYRCSSGQCIKASYKCDGSKDCYDDSDEQNCSLIFLSTPKIFVPDIVTNGDSVMLECYRGENESVDTYKWYKNNEEFYRFTRDDWLLHQIDQDVKGIYFNRDTSFVGRVRLNETTEGSEGIYKCEVSSEAPHILTAQAEKEMKIVDDCRKMFTNPFTCSNYNCINDDWVCDGKDNCYDGSDEEDCENRVCKDNQYRCSSGQCIAGSGRCDGLDHCSDKTDEKYCGNDEDTENSIASTKEENTEATTHDVEKEEKSQTTTQDEQSTMEENVQITTQDEQSASEERLRIMIWKTIH